MESSDDDDAFLTADESDILGLISERTQFTRKVKLEKPVTTSLGLSWSSNNDLDLKFSLKVEKPRIPPGFNKDLKINERTKLLKEIVKADEAQANSELNEKNSLTNFVRQQLSANALKNDKYVKYVVDRYNDESANLKSVRFFSRQPPEVSSSKRRKLSSLMVRPESYTVTDLELVNRQASVFGSKVASWKLDTISSDTDHKVIETIDKLTYMMFPRSAFGASDFLAADVLQEELQIFLKEIGADSALIDSQLNTDLKDVRSLDNFEDLPSIELSIHKLSIAVNIFMNGKCAVLLQLTGLPGATAGKNVIECEKFECHYFHMLRLVILALTDPRVHNSPHVGNFYFSKAKVAGSLMFDNLVGLYIKVFSSMGSSEAKSFTRLSQKTAQLVSDLTTSNAILSKFLSCLLQANLSSVSKQLVMWMCLVTIVRGLDNDCLILKEDELKDILTFQLSETSIELRSEMVFTKLCLFLKLIRSKRSPLRSTIFREDVFYFKDISASFTLLEKLIVTSIPMFNKMETLNDKLFSKRHILDHTHFIIEKRTMVPHMLSTFITQLKTTHFENFDLTANPVLGRVMNILGRLILILENELTIQVMDLELPKKV